MSAITQLEENLNDVFTKKVPALPENIKKFIVEWSPWFALIGGVLTLWAAWTLWQWAHVADDLINWSNRLSESLGGGTVSTSSMTAGIWLAIAVLALQAVLYLLAFPGLRDRKKSGWNLLFYGMIVNVVYGVVVVFTDYGGVSSLFGTLVGTAIGGYVLFQVRDHYLGEKRPAAPTTTPKVA